MKRSDLTVQIIDIIRSIPHGRVATYGQVAMMAGHPRHARQVAWILHSLSEQEELPWHRVINSRGTISLQPGHGFERQKSLLESEGIPFTEENGIDLGRFLWDPGHFEGLEKDRAE